MFRCINAKIEGNKTMRFPLGEGDQTPLGQGLFWRGKDKNNQFQDFHSGANINKFHGIYYQEQTSSIKSIKKPSLTCTYEQQDKGYFALAMGRRGVRKVNASAIKQDRLWVYLLANPFMVCKVQIVKLVNLASKLIELLT
jgi:hypothetical protein